MDSAQIMESYGTRLAQQTDDFQSNLPAAKRDLNLTPQEEFLYRAHLHNLEISRGGVPNPQGGKSTLYQMSFERDGKFYNIPTVWEGKFVKPDEAIGRAEAVGLDKFPSYQSEEEAETRYDRMHDYMQRDLQQYNDR